MQWERRTRLSKSRGYCCFCCVCRFVLHLSRAFSDIPRTKHGAVLLLVEHARQYHSRWTQTTRQSSPRHTRFLPLCQKKAAAFLNVPAPSAVRPPSFPIVEPKEITPHAASHSYLSLGLQGCWRFRPPGRVNLALPALFYPALAQVTRKEYPGIHEETRHRKREARESIAGLIHHMKLLRSTTSTSAPHYIQISPILSSHGTLRR